MLTIRQCLCFVFVKFDKSKTNRAKSDTNLIVCPIETDDCVIQLDSVAYIIRRVDKC